MAKTPAAAPTPRSARKRGRPTAAQQSIYLDELRGGATVKQAAAAAGRDRFAFVYLRQQDEAFAVLHADAYDEGADVLEAVAWERATSGVERTRIDKDGTAVECNDPPSDRLLELLLKARRPAKFRENSKVEHVGKGDGPIQTETVGVALQDVLAFAQQAGAIPANSELPRAPSDGE